MVHLDSDESVFKNNSGIFKLIDEIRELASFDIIYFKNPRLGWMGQRVEATLRRLLEHLEAVKPSVKRIATIAPIYDFKPSHQANGYHSLLTIFRKCCLKILETIRSITIYKESWFFNKTEHFATLEEFVTVLGQLRACFYYMERLNSFCNDRDLFPDESSLTEDEYASSIGLMYEFETLNPECFYGRCLAFQYASSMIRPLTVINQALACHGKVFPKTNRITKLASGILSAKKYFGNIEERAKQISAITRECEVDFCQSFWSISDNPTLVRLSLLVSPAVVVDCVMTIPFEEFQLPASESDGMVSIKPVNPQLYKNPRIDSQIKDHVSVRLLSSKLRSGQEAYLSKLGCLYQSWKGQKEDKSPYLIVHLHGGGYVGQSSASHEVYLRDWAVRSDVPILSVDYCHAPQFRAPYQLEEAFFAYCWALKNSSLLGSTAERVVVVGDSAGGNLAVGVGLMAAQRGVRRPDGVYPIYGSMMIQYKPGPSRLLAIMDPLIPLGILSVCLQAYLGTVDCTQSDVKFEEPSEGECADDELDDDIPQQSCMPPSLPRSYFSVSPSFTTALWLRSMKLPNSFVPQIDSPMLHKRNDSGFFDSLPCERRLSKDLESKRTKRANNGDSDSRRNNAFVKCEDYLSVNELSTSSEETNISEDVSECSSSSVKDRKTNETNLSNVVASYAQLKTFRVSPMARSLKNNPGDSPFISPVLAPDNLLRTLNRVHITACHLDPLLDDSITLARRLRDAQVPVGLHLVPDLPHGFLNFVMLSSEATRASVQCLNNVMCLLKGLPTED